MKKRFSSALALSAAALLATGCSAPATDPDSGAELRTVTVAVTSPNHPVEFFAIHLADKLGFFAEEGLQVKVEEAPGSGGALQLLLAGNAQFATPSPPGHFSSIANGNDSRLVYQMKYANVFDIVAPTGSSLTGIAQAEGKNVGVSALSGGEVPFVRAVLGSVGLADGQNVSIVPVGEGGQVTVQAFESDQIVAFGGSVYDLAVLAANGFDFQSVVPADFQQQPANSIVTTPGFIESDPEVISSFLRAVAKAEVFAEANDSAARELIRKDHPELYSSDALFNELWDTTVRLMDRPDGFDHGAFDWAGWERFYASLAGLPADQGGLKAQFEIRNQLDEQFVKAANEFDADAVKAAAEKYEVK